MFALYNYKPGSTKEAILADIGKILTGTTDPAQLSSSCVAANSYITAQYDPAGWSIHDANCGVNQLCIKAPCLDGVTFKYVILNLNNVFTFACYEAWNATTHAGTNPIYYSNNAIWQPELANTHLSITSGGYISIYASAQELIFNFKATGGWSSVGASRYIVEEFTRLSDNMDVARGYPCWGASINAGQNQLFKSPRLKSPAAAGDSVGTNPMASFMLNSTFSWNSAKKPPQCRDSITNALYNTIFPLNNCLAIQTDRQDDLQYAINYDALGYFCTKAIITNYESGSVLDELEYEGKTYICYGTYGLSHSQVNNWFPKG